MTTRPRFDTDRDLSRRTTGGQVARVAAAMGWRLDDWQRHVADVTGELDPDTDGYWYDTVLLHVGRRAGKTTVSLPTLVQRAVERPGRRCWYTSAKRAAASSLWRDEWSPRLKLLPATRVRDSNGSESATFRPPGSSLALFAPSRTGIHSADADTVVVDEAWSFDVARGDDVLAAVRPAMARATRRRQLWIVSAGGDEGSSWLTRWLRVARSPDTRPRRLAVFDYSADPDRDDVHDPAVWARVHPSVASGGITLDYLRSEHDADPVMFARSYLCVPTGQTVVADPAFDTTRWGDLVDTTRDDGAPFLAFDVSADREGAAIVAAWPRSGAGAVIELVDVVAPHDLVGRVAGLRRKHPTRAILADGRGPSASAVDAVRRAGIDVDTRQYQQVAAAASSLFDSIRAGTVRHRGQDTLTAAVEGARRRRYGDAWVLARATVPDAVAVAAALAHDPASLADPADRPLLSAL